MQRACIALRGSGASLDRLLKKVLIPGTLNFAKCVMNPRSSFIWLFHIPVWFTLSQSFISYLLSSSPSPWLTLSTSIFANSIFNYLNSQLETEWNSRQVSILNHRSWEKMNLLSSSLFMTCILFCLHIYQLHALLRLALTNYNYISK